MQRRIMSIYCTLFAQN